MTSLLFSFLLQVVIEKDENSYYVTMPLMNVTVEDAGKYKVTAKNELGESSASISLNFDSKQWCCSLCLLYLYLYCQAFKNSFTGILLSGSCRRFSVSKIEVFLYFFISAASEDQSPFTDERRIYTNLKLR